MSLTIYNSIWGFVKLILEPYLERRVKKGKEDVHRINERYGISNKIRPKGTLIWLHGTSVGESVAALALANSMKKNGIEYLQNILPESSAVALLTNEFYVCHELHFNLLNPFTLATFAPTTWHVKTKMTGSITHDFSLSNACKNISYTVKSLRIGSWV